MKDQTVDRCVEQLNSLLRGEISAAETYRMAIDKVGGDRQSDGAALRTIAQEHGEHAQRLRDEIRRAGGHADDASGTWGAYAKTIEGAASLFGDAAALKALKEGEEHGLKDYRAALDAVDEPARKLIAETLIPAQQRHITSLDALIARA
ncbi:MAG: PA2169 family four-helix-bundle protein [Acidobacteria bacterium]|nr:PA2169 family four-helix-bundle protein [Acidobacteriota bacterium]MCA1612211.1 PA2169 family four-helix-bundle protein [Acidobacteriota bacterium]